MSIFSRARNTSLYPLGIRWALWLDTARKFVLNVGFGICSKMIVKKIKVKFICMPSDGDHDHIESSCFFTINRVRKREAQDVYKLVADQSRGT